MSNSTQYFQLYQQSVASLIKTAVIKYSANAIAYNNGVMEDHPGAIIDTQDERTWRHYQNMAGMYHDVDTVMTVVSLDTLQTVVFNKQTLASHPQTKQAYLYGTALHAELVSRYPNQVCLILGILYAPDRAGYLDEIIAAEDGTLLYCDTRFIEDQEHSLLYELQRWLNQYTIRWHNRDYSFADNLYMADYMWKLSLNLMQKVYTLRLKNCKTEQAHTFYIRLYLASHGALDAYMDLLTKEQILFLYRNVLYIENHAGRQEVFYWLVENLLTVRNLPLYEYKVYHNTFYQIPTQENNGSASPTPVPYFKRKAINVAEFASVGAEVPFDAMLTKLKDATVDNQQYQSDHRDQMYKSLIYSPSSVVRTKVLESILADNSRAVPYPLEDIIINHWIGWAASGQYSARATLRLPGTKKDYSLSMLELLVLLVYVEAKLQNVTLLTVPDFIASRLQRPTAVTTTELRSVTSPTFVTDAVINQIAQTYVPVGQLTTVADFYTAVSSIYMNTLQHQRLVYGHGSSIASSQIQIACSRLYQDQRLSCIYSGQTYDSFLTARGLTDSVFTLGILSDLKSAIIGLISNYELNVVDTQKAVQQAMIKIFSQLTSYSTLVIGDMAQLSIEHVQGQLVRPDQWVSGLRQNDAVRINQMDVVSEQTNITDHTFLDINVLKPVQYDTVHAQRTDVFMPMNYISSGYQDSSSHEQWASKVISVMSTDDYYSAYNALSTPQKQALPL